MNYNFRQMIKTGIKNCEAVDRKTFNLEYNGLLFKPYMSILVEQAIEEYDYSDMKPTDVVLDIGASVGGFSLMAARMCERVYAVEPLFYEELENNLFLNGADNVHIIKGALSSTRIDDCCFEGRKVHTRGYTITNLINLAGSRVDFLKCDCEGGEWVIRPEELDGIRRIEMEIHKIKGREIEVYIQMLKDCGYDVKIDNRTKHTCLAHCFK